MLGLCLGGGGGGPEAVGGRFGAGPAGGGGEEKEGAGYLLSSALRVRTTLEIINPKCYLLFKDVYSNNSEFLILWTFTIL